MIGSSFDTDNSERSFLKTENSFPAYKDITFSIEVPSKDAKIDSLENGNKLYHRAIGISKQVKNLIKISIRFKPKYFLVVGDREEAIVTAIVATYLQIPLIHIGGGDRVVGNIDDHVRHAVSKLAHLHFVNNIESKKRLFW